MSPLPKMPKLQIRETHTETLNYTRALMSQRGAAEDSISYLVHELQKIFETEDPTVILNSVIELRY